MAVAKTIVAVMGTVGMVAGAFLAIRGVVVGGGVLFVFAGLALGEAVDG